MANRWLIWFALIILNGCQSAPVQEEVRESQDQPEERAITQELPHSDKPIERKDNVLIENGETVEPKITEYLMWSDLSINNNIPMHTNFSQVVSLVGKPDSVHTPDSKDSCNSCHFCGSQNPPVVFSHFKGLLFEQLNDSLIFWSVDFVKSPDLFLQFKEIQLDRNTTLEQIGNYFPQSVRRREKRKDQEMIWIDATNKPVDGGWALSFSNEGRLIQFSYWFPC